MTAADFYAQKTAVPSVVATVVEVAAGWPACSRSNRLIRQDPKAPINLVRLWAVIPGVKSSLLYDMLNNHTYRKVRGAGEAFVVLLTSITGVGREHD